MEHALLASSDSGCSAYPPSSSSTLSSITIPIQDVQPLPQPATAVPVKNNSVHTSSSTNAAVEKKKPKMPCGVILKPPKNKSYRPKDIKILGKRFDKKDIVDALLEAGYSSDSSIYRNLDGVSKIAYSSL